MTTETKPVAKLLGQNGNVFNLMAICIRAMRKAGYNQTQVHNFRHEVMDSGSYDEALQIMMKWCEVR